MVKMNRRAERRVVAGYSRMVDDPLRQRTLLSARIADTTERAGQKAFSSELADHGVQRLDIEPVHGSQPL
jgi:hypothetical protein